MDNMFCLSAILTSIRHRTLRKIHAGRFRATKLLPIKYANDNQPQHAVKVHEIKTMQRPKKPGSRVVLQYGK